MVEQIESVIKAWNLIERIGESDFNKLVKDESVIKFTREIIDVVENNRFIEARFDNLKGKIDDFVLPIYIGAYEGQVLRDALGQDGEGVEPDTKLQFSAILFFNHKSELLRDDSFIPASTVMLGELKDVDVQDAIEKMQSEISDVWDTYIEQDMSFYDKLAEVVKYIQMKFPNASDDIYISKRAIQKIENDHMHSNFSRDFKHILQLKTNELGNLKRYIEGFDGVQFDLEGEGREVYRKILAPNEFPDSRWPSNPKFALSLMQQFAVNLALNDKNDVRTVNGPPGTGKTTLLKDVFANITVQQAEKMAEFSDPNDLIVKGEHFGWDSESSQFHVDWHLDKKLEGYGIVVASSNNKAVENISQELPKTPELLENDAFSIDYFSRAYSKFYDAPAPEETWGFFSGTGGNSNNVGKLIDAIKGLIDEAGEAEPIDWGEARKQFKVTLRKVREIKQETQKWVEVIWQHEGVDVAAIEREINDRRQQVIDVSGELAGLYAEQSDLQDTNSNVGLFGKLFKKKDSNFEQKHALNNRIKQLENLKQQFEQQIVLLEQRKASNGLYEEALAYFENKGVQVLDQNFWDNSNDDIQLSMLWFDNEFRTLQSRLFVEAMRLKKAAIIAIIQKSDKNPFTHVLTQTWKHRAAISRSGNQGVLKHTWDMIQFLVPVISSTFASFGNFFAELSTGALDHVFIDEAGQALPGYAAGAFWRAKRIMAVGDPYQIAPVQAVDPVMLGLIKDYYGLNEVIYTNPNTSVQTLGDRASQYGAKLDESWVGVPLWAHRRCIEPMFSIANRISYHDKMVQAAGHDVGASHWFDVQGKATRKQYVPEHGEMLMKAIEKRLSLEPKVELNEIFVISPFKVVENEVTHLLKPTTISNEDFASWHKNNVGTVHKFQGKEAKIVFFMLGGDDTMGGSVTWATTEPNLLNVAATRAKEEFYVIGDKHAFGQYGNLDIVVNMIDKFEVSDKWADVKNEMAQLTFEKSDGLVNVPVWYNQPKGNNKPKLAYIIVDDRRYYPKVDAENPGYWLIDVNDLGKDYDIHQDYVQADLNKVTFNGTLAELKTLGRVKA